MSKRPNDGPRPMSEILQPLVQSVAAGAAAARPNLAAAIDAAADAEKSKKRALPTSCQECVFHRMEQGSRAEEVICRRHAPSPVEGVSLQLAYWPQVHVRCGAGADVRQPGDAEVIPCVDCVHWFQPNGIGFQPKYREGKSPEWWEHTGYCTAHAPYPTTEKRIVTPCATHASAGCGDGKHIGDVGDEMADAAGV